MALWTPDPFAHFRCTVGDLLMHRRLITPQCLARCGLTVRVMRERYGLTPDLMCELKYTPQERVDLGLSIEESDTLLGLLLWVMGGANSCH